MRVIIIVALLCISTFNGFAQNNYWIFINPTTHPNASSPFVIRKIANKNTQIIGTSKWFNALYVSIKNPKELKRIQKYTFIKGIESSKTYKSDKHDIELFDSLNYGQADVQLNMLGLQTFHSEGFTGKGITIALFDGGFYKVDSINAFDSLRKRGGILATRDFHDNHRNVYDDDAHGMHVLSLISGYINDSLNGSAPDANYLLARTEVVNSEKHLEEFNWIKALEWADSIGVDIIHSSLGYSVFDSLEGNYTYKDMDGQSTIITRAAEMAFKRGIFITNSAGNEGGSKWKYITAPCDGKNVLCIGAVDSFQNHAKFSSFGPSSDGRVKPDVMAMGKNVTIIGTNGIMRRGSGTSFSGPIMAGFVACLKQRYPNVNNTLLLEAIRKSGHLYRSPNDSMGFGIPNIIRADSLIKIKLSESMVNPPHFKIYPNPCNSKVYIESEIPIQHIEIIDFLGKIHRPKLVDQSFETDNLIAGVYYLKVNNYRVIKLIKQE